MERRETILPNGIRRHDIARADADVIRDSVLEYFGKTMAEIMIDSRKLSVLVPRHFIHYYLSVTEMSLREIGLVTLLDHATVLRSREVVENWIGSDKHFRAQAYAIAQLIINNNQLKQTKNESISM